RAACGAWSTRATLAASRCFSTSCTTTSDRRGNTSPTTGRISRIRTHAPGAPARAARRVHVVPASHDNDRRLVLPTSAGGLGLDAVWSDDFRHALHRALTGETAGYYADFGGDHHIARVISQGFSFQGETAAYWGRPRGTPSADLPGDHFVIFLQNHDQVGNRPQ